jgi:hypothetical protein
MAPSISPGQRSEFPSRSGVSGPCTELRRPVSSLLYVEPLVDGDMLLAPHRGYAHLCQTAHDISIAPRVTATQEPRANSQLLLAG